MLLFSSSSSSVITEISTDYKTLGSVAVVLALSQAEALVEPRTVHYQTNSIYLGPRIHFSHLKLLKGLQPTLFPAVT